MPVVPSVQWVPTVGIISRGFVRSATLSLTFAALIAMCLGRGIRQFSLCRKDPQVVPLPIGFGPS